MKEQKQKSGTGSIEELKLAESIRKDFVGTDGQEVERQEKQEEKITEYGTREASQDDRLLFFLKEGGNADGKTDDSS